MAKYMKRLQVIPILVMLILVFQGINSYVSEDQISTLGVIENDNIVKELDNLPNIIFMIGDGMGVEQLKAASMVEYGVLNGTIMDYEFSDYGLYGTNDIENKTTDSAAAGTALSTGQLTNYGRVGMKSNGETYVKNILEYLRYDFGYSSGIVSTTHIAHATPATYVAHSNSRHNYEEILSQMLNHELEVILGGGQNAAYIGNKNKAKTLAKNSGYDDIATNREELMKYTNTSEKLFGIFGQYQFEGGTYESHMPYELWRNTTLDPSLIEMTEAAINVLEKNPNPFFLMVEGGRIDHAGHRSFNTEDAYETKNQLNIIETIFFEKSVKKALEFAKNDGNTIVIVCSDHETGGMKLIDYSGLSTDDLPNKDMNRIDQMSKRLERISLLNVTWQGTAHTDTFVPIYAYGLNIDNFNVNQIIDIFWILNEELGSFPVIDDYKFTMNDGVLDYYVSLKDLDTSATKINLFAISNDEISIMNEINIEFNNMAIMNYNNSMNIEFNETVEFFIEIMDGNNSVFSLGSQNNLIAQQVEHLKPIFETTTITQSSSNQTLSETMLNSTIVSTSTEINENTEGDTTISSKTSNENIYFHAIPLWLSGYAIVYIRRKKLN